MVPKYIDIRAAPLPKTPTGKVVKAALREVGADGAWAASGARRGREST
jgi:hypothetical protein